MKLFSAKEAQKEHATIHQGEIPKGIFIIAGALIVALAAFLRFFNIFSIPCGLFPDQAIAGLEAIQGPILPFYTSYGPHEEGLYTILVKIVYGLFGVHDWGIFVLSAFLGT
jgi:4-amino-4-deoxy-L-arabinose transferase-like glycosyltransferase